jgi:hypothetical protein
MSVRLKKIQVRCQGICQLIDQADEAGLVVELNELWRALRDHIDDPKILNPNDCENACDIELELGNIGELTIICKGAECSITQEDDEITVGKFSVRHIDGHSDVFLKTLNAESVYFNITGTVSIQQLTTTNGG